VMMTAIRPELELPVQSQLHLLQIPRSSYYWHLKQPAVALADPQEMLLREKIQAICVDQASYGYRRVTHELRHQGVLVNHKRVKRLMEEDNLLCLRKKAFAIPTTDSNHSYRVYPNLVPGLVLERTNQLWVADITYIHLRREFIYLAVLLDGYSRRVIGWALSRNIDAALTVDALTMALASRQYHSNDQQLVHHSDRGVQYACTAYVDCLRSHNVSISMSRKGNPYDNAKAESFMKTLKHEEVYMNEYESLEDARRNIDAFLHNYNHRRLHSSLGYLAPASFENLIKQPQLGSTLTTAFSVQ
jgi:putative transposase